MVKVKNSFQKMLSANSGLFVGRQLADSDNYACSPNIVKAMLINSDILLSLAIFY